MRGLIYREPADMVETGERSKGNKLGINTHVLMKCLAFLSAIVLVLISPLMTITCKYPAYTELMLADLD